jgi:hypothetical protein
MAAEVASIAWINACITPLATVIKALQKLALFYGGAPSGHFKGRGFLRRDRKAAH